MYFLSFLADICNVITTVIVGNTVFDVQIVCIDQHTELKHNSINNKTMEQDILNRLEAIERYSLLAAKNVLCFDDVALLTGFSKSHLYKLTCSHQIPHYKPNGKQIYFDRAEVEAWMKQNRVATTQEIDQKATTYVVTGRMQKGGLK